MTSVSVSRAKATLSQLVEQARLGHPTTITSRGEAVAVLVPVDDDRLHVALQAALTLPANAPNPAPEPTSLLPGYVSLADVLRAS